MASRDETLKLLIQTEGDANLKALSDAIAGVGTQAGIADPQIRELVDKLTKLNDTNKQVNSLISLNSQIDANAQKLTAAKDRVAQYTTEIAANGVATQAQSAGLSSAQKTVDSLTGSQGRLQEKAAILSGTLHTQGVNVSNLGEAHAQLGQHISTTSGHITELAKTSAEAAEAHRRHAEQVKRLGEHLLELVGFAAAAEIAIKAVEFGKEQISGAADVEAIFSRIKATAKDAGEAFGELDKKVEEAAKAVNVSTQVSAEALSSLVRNGLTAKESFDALIPTLELAKIANIGVGEASADVVHTLKLFGIQASDTARVVDVLTTASLSSEGGLGTFTDALSKVAPSARELGLDLDTTATLLGVITRSGVETGKASKGLQKIFEDLRVSTSPLRVALSGLGDNSSDFQKAIATAGKSSKNTDDILKSLGGSSRNIFELFLQQGPAAFNAVKDAIEHSNGAAKTFIQTLDDNLHGSLSRISNAVEGAGIALAKPILEPLQKELTALAKYINEFAETDDFKRLAVSIGQFTEDAAKAFDGFIHGINWGDLAKDAAKAVSDTQKEIHKIGENISDTVTVVGKTGTAAALVFDGLKTGIHGVVAATVTAGDQFTNGFIPAIHGTAESLREGLIPQMEDTNAKFDKLFNIVDEADDKLGAATRAADRAAAALQILNNSNASAAVSTGVLKESVKAASDQLGLLPDYTAKAADGFTLLGAHFGEADKALDGLQSQADAAKKELELLTISGERNAVVLQTAIEKYQTLKAKLDEYKESADSAAKSTEKGNEAIKGVQEEVTKAHENLRLLSAATDRNQEAINGAAEAYANALNKLSALKKEFGDTAISAEELKSSFHNLGIKSQFDLQDLAEKAKTSFDNINAAQDGTTAKLADAQQAFLVYAKRRLESVKDLDDASKQQAETDLDVQSSALRLGDQLGKLEGSVLGVTAAFKGNRSGGVNLAGNYNDATTAIGRYTLALHNAGNTGLSDADRLVNANIAITHAANDRQKAAAENVRSDISNFELGRDHIAAYGEAVQGVSQKVVNEFNQISKTALESTRGLSAFGAQYAQTFNDLSIPLNNSIAKQREQVASLTQAYAGFAATATASENDTAASLQARANSLADFSRSLRDGTSQFDLLDQQSLSGLQAQIDATRQKTQSLADVARSAADQLKSLNQQLQDQVDANNNNQTSIENRRYQTQLQQIKDLQDKTGAAGLSEANQALALAQQVHDDAIKKIEQQAAAQQQASNQQAQQAAQQQKQQQSTQNSTPPPPPSNPANQTAQLSRLEITVKGDTSGLNPADTAQMNAIANAVLNQIQNAQGSSGVHH